MDPVLVTIITAAATVLLPALPMLLLFRLLPNQQMSVEGPFQNLTVRATGAVAGWFVGFVGLFFALLVPTVTRSAALPFGVWKVEGRVVLADGTYDGGSFDMIIDPPTIKPSVDGAFTISGVPVRTDYSDPTILKFKRPGLLVDAVLNPGRPNVKFGKGTIDVGTLKFVSVQSHHGTNGQQAEDIEGGGQ